jgi:hypothetical protein
VCSHCGTSTAQEPLPAFGAIDYTNVMIDGSPLSACSPSPVNYYEGKKNQITTGPLTGGGTAFATTEG